MVKSWVCAVSFPQKTEITVDIVMKRIENLEALKGWKLSGGNSKNLYFHMFSSDNSDVLDISIVFL